MKNFKAQSVCYSLIITLLFSAAQGESSSLQFTSSASKNSIELVGTVTSADQEYNRAIIRDLSTSTQTIYKKNSILPSGARIIQVLSDRILLEKKGRRIVILLDNSQRPHNSFEGINKLAPDRWEINPNKMFPSIIDVIKLSSGIKFSKFYNKGVLVGFRIDKLEKGHLLAELGLKAGDVVASINGRGFDSITALLEFLWSVDNASSLDIVLYRENNEKTLSYDVSYNQPVAFSKQAASKAITATASFRRPRNKKQSFHTLLDVTSNIDRDENH